MPKSTPVVSGRRGGRSGRGTVTVIEDRVSRSYLRRAKIAFVVVAVVVGLLAASIAASYWHPVLAFFAGAVIGVVAALPVAAVIAAWPVIRVIWWWLPEIILFSGAVYGFWMLSAATSVQLRIGILMMLAAPMAFPQVRAWAKRPFMCLVTRHRLRTCFAEFIISNNRGSLPLLLWTTPTKVGERVWLWLRPGLSLADVQARLDHIATGCWAAQARAEAASATNAALVRLDIIRRDGLTGTVVSELPDRVGEPADSTIDAAADKTAATQPASTSGDNVVVGLNLRDVPESAETTSKTNGTKAGGKPPGGNDTGSQAGKEPALNTYGVGGPDAADWI
ncbi:hypothetical protein [Spirillospora sp. NPDC047279]|uniref:hypothetical protein n=1 Tax=Spirillospora sp. NPDC047279 TaxID=3155478 RepID=UPI0033FD9422